MRAHYLGVLAALVCGAAAAQAQNAPATPPCSGPEYRQLDFWVGEWDLEFTNQDGSVGKATNRITRDEYGTCAISEHFVQPGGGADGGDFIGGSYSTYDAQTKSWRQMWVDNAGGLFDLRGGPVTGQRHKFELVNIEPRGPKKATLRMIWEDVTQDSLTWRWQSKNPDGSWTDRWVLRYKRRAPAGR
jgi:hypothetical protein